MKKNYLSGSARAGSRRQQWLPLLLTALLLWLGLSASHAQVTVTATGGATGTTYTTLGAAFTAINAGTHTGTITVALSASTTETATASLNASGSGAASYTSVLVQPTVASVVVAGGVSSAAIVQLNGAANVTIDGRPGGTAAAAPYTTHLIIRNTTASGQALAFTNDAKNNAVRYCQLQGTTNSTASGVVLFTGTSSVAGGGNSNNTVQYNSIGGFSGNPYNCVYSSGSGTGTNTGNVVDGNNILDFFNATNSVSGISLAAGNNSGWVITNNAFYQSGTRTYTANSTSNVPIRIGSTSATAGSGYTIVGNRIGGSAGSGATFIAPNAPAPSNPAVAYTLAGAFSTRFIGLLLNTATGTGTTASTIQGNTLQAISLTSTDATAGGFGTFSAIYLPGGDATIGGTGTVTTNGVTVSQVNTIGSATAAASILVSASTTGSTTYGINSASAGTVTIQGNAVAGIRATGASATIGANVVGIQVAAGTHTLTGNAVGNATTGLSSTAAVTGSVAQAVRGIYLTGGSNTLTGNSVTNLVNAASSSGGVSTGIFATTGPTLSVIGGPAAGNGNAVYGFGNAATNTGTGSGAAVVGIGQQSTTSAGQNIVGNQVYNLTATGAGAGVSGIAYSAPTTGSTLVSRNLVYNLIGSTNAANTLVGIYAGAGLSTAANNMVRLGLDNSGASQGNGLLVFSGLQKAAGSLTAIHNSVYVGGSATASSGSANSAAFVRSAAGTDVLANNALVNVRAQGSGNTGQHVPVQLTTTSTLTVSNNVYYTTNALATPTAEATVSGTAVATIPGDTGSQLADPQFAAPTAATPDQHIAAGSTTTPVEGTGTSAYTTTDDYDGETRSTLTPVDVGADAGNFAGFPVITYSPLGNTTLTGDRTLTATITASAGLASGTGAPRIYFAKNGGAYQSAVATTVSGSSYTFIISASALGGLTTGDVVSYYVAAQDVNGNVTTNPAGGSGSNPPGSTAPATPNQYTIVVALAGPFYVGSGQPYTSLTGTLANNGLFAALNAGILASGSQQVYITSDLTEDGSTALNALSTSGSGVSLTIQSSSASAARTISGNYVASGTASLNGLVRLNGTQNVTLTGGAANSNAASAPRLLTFRNVGTAPVFLLYNGASADNLNNLVVEGNVASTTAGTITLDGNSAATSNLTLAYNDVRDQNTAVSGVTAGASAYGVYGLGPNNAITLTGNTLRNFTAGGVYSAGGDSWTVGGSSTAAGNLVYEEASQSGTLVGIQLTAGNTHNVSYNSLYQAGGSLSGQYTGIAVTGGGAGHVIGNNAVGGTAAGARTNTGSFSTSALFRGIVLTVSTTGTATLVQGNGITGVNSTNSFVTATYGTNVTSYGIYVSAGAVTVGGSTPALGNVVSNINVAYAFTGIYLPAAVGTLAVQNNTVSNVAFANNNNNNTGANNVNIPFLGIAVVTPAGVTSNLLANTISNFTQTSSTATSANTIAVRGLTRAIDAAGTGTTNLTGNTIMGVGTGSGGAMNYANKVYGIYGADAGTYGVTSNTISALSNNAGASNGFNAITAGVFLENTAGTYTVTGNGVSDVANTTTLGTYGSNAGSYVQVTGIHLNTTATATAARNRVSNVRNTSPGGLSTSILDGAAGLTVLGGAAGTSTLANNQVSVPAPTSTTAAYGVLVTSTGTTPTYYNTAYVGGTTAAGSNSFAYYRSSASGTATLRDNIFYSEATGGTGNYAIGNTSATSFPDANYNLYVTAVTTQMGRLGATGGSTDYDFAGWKTATGGDGSSAYRQPTAADIGGSSSSLFQNAAAGNLLINSSFNNTPSPIRMGGTTVAAVTDDYQGDSRTSPPDLGSDQYSTTPLPVQLVKFEAQRQGQDAALTWTTASELNNRGFEVQESADGASFRVLGFVAGAGSSASAHSYQYLDREAGKASARYYRLRQVDQNGTSAYSPVRVVQFEGGSAVTLTAAPNPFHGELTLHLALPAAQPAGQLTVTDALGRPVLTQQVAELPAGASELALPSVATLPAGVYVLHLAGQHLRVVKE